MNTVWAQGYSIWGQSLAISAIVAALPNRRIALSPRSKAKTRMGGGFVWPWLSVAGRAGGISGMPASLHAQFGGIRGRIRTVPYFLDRVLGYRAL